MDNELKNWRKAERERLIAVRLALSAGLLAQLRAALDVHLERAFPGLAQGVIAFCWPFQNEYDARFLVRRLRGRGASTALPVVVKYGQPLIFRLWKPGDALAKGVYDIPYPASGDAVVPDVALVPMNGFDASAGGQSIFATPPPAMVRFLRHDDGRTMVPTQQLDNFKSGNPRLLLLP